MEFFEKVIELQRKYAGGKQVRNTLQTNGVLLDDRWCEFLAAKGFLVGLSIDGPRELHDKYRVDRGGGPSFDRVVRGIECLRKHGVEFNTLTVVQRDNSQHPLEVYRFLKEIGSGFMQFIPVVERLAASGGEDGLVLISPDSAANARVTEWSVDARQYGKFLCAIFDEWVRRDVGRIFVQMFDVTLESWVGAPSSLCVFNPTCGDALAMEHNGDVYSCDHYVYPRNRLGNVLESSLTSMVESRQQRACYGECPKHRFIKTPDGEPGLNYLCAAYKKFFSHVDPYMAFMAGELANQRPPANEMAWVRERDGASSDRRGVGRNDPCPCGSGRKYKKCCN